MGKIIMNKERIYLVIIGLLIVIGLMLGVNSSKSTDLECNSVLVGKVEIPEMEIDSISCSTVKGVDDLDRVLCEIRGEDNGAPIVFSVPCKVK